MIRRSDLKRVVEIAERHAPGLDIRLYGDTNGPRSAVYLLFSETPNPSISPELKTMHGKAVSVIPVQDLVRMKLNSYRLKDQVHLQVMDAAGLITAEVEKALPE